MLSKPALGSIHPLIEWIPEASSPGVVQQGHEADSPPASAEGKKSGSMHPLPHIPLLSRGVSLPFYLLIHLYPLYKSFHVRSAHLTTAQTDFNKVWVMYCNPLEISVLRLVTQS
jgi:hypothetical protein